jgi:hypothetical protein
MSGIAAAVGVGAAVVSTGVQMYGSAKAAKSQKNALNQQGETSQSNYELQKQLLSPYQTSGANALGQMQTGLARPMTEAQLAEAEGQYQRELGAYKNWQNDVAKVKAWYAANPDAQKGLPIADFLAQHYPERPEPVKPTNEGRGEFIQRDLANSPEFSQRINMTPEEFFAAEAAAGRPIADTNWNKNFNVDEYLGKFGKSEADLYKNFDMTAWLSGQGREANALTRDFAMTDYQADPGYTFRLAQGNKSLENSASGRGMQLSGATLKALADYNQGEASNEYQNAVNRFNTNRSNLQQVGYNAQEQFGADRTNMVGNVANAYNRFGTDQNKLYGKFTDAYNRQSGAKQTDFSNITRAMQQDYSNLAGLNDQGFQATLNLANAATSNADNQMGMQAGIGNANTQQALNTGNALSGLVGTVGGVASNYLSRQTLPTYNSGYSNALTGYTPYTSPNFNLY